MPITRLTIFGLALFGATFFSLAQETSVEQTGASLRASAGKVSIVPPFPTRMGGFFDRTDTFTGVKSPVFARALVCATEDDAVAVVTTDLLWMPRNLADAVRETAASRTTLKPDHILLSAAHNHSAPAGFSEQSLFGGPHNPELFAFMRDALTDAIVEAYAELRPAQLSYGAGLLEHFSRNRQQNNDTVVDPEVGVLKIAEADSRIVIATLFNFTGHPVVLGSGNLLICGEYPGAAEQFVEDAIGGVALFTQGACGDVTVHRSGDPYLEVERLGRVLGAEVIKTAETAPRSEMEVLYSRLEDVEVEPRVFPERKEAELNRDDLKNQLADAKQRGTNAAAILRLEKELDSAEWGVRIATLTQERPGALPLVDRAPVHVMQIGPLVLVGIPGELFVEYGLEIKQRVRQSKDRPLMVVGFANDYLGYLVTPRAVHTGGYEQATARLQASAPRAMTEAAMQWVEEGIH
ncbi:MAG: hypothetical protein AMXMBFR82_37670 [Candidatus Hydrogenedentota bacterium]